MTNLVDRTHAIQGLLTAEQKLRCLCWSRKGRQCSVFVHHVNILVVDNLLRRGNFHSLLKSGLLPLMTNLLDCISVVVVVVDWMILV